VTPLPLEIIVCLVVSICPFSNPHTKEPRTDYFILSFFDLSETQTVSLSQKHTLPLPLCHTHTLLLHSHSHCSQSSIPTIKPGDRCWISSLEEKSSAPLIGVELAWRAGRQVHHEKRSRERGERECVCVCQRMQPSHPIY